MARKLNVQSTPEWMRVLEDQRGDIDWGLWGTYLPDRQWGTVRECYCPSLDAWRSFTHDQSRSRVYRWGEDGLLGLSDRHCMLCFAPSFWNHRDPILKERLFGLANHEGNHGEDVKEVYYHLLNTPSHSYAKGLYVYPIQAFPYDELVDANQARARTEAEYELEDTGVFKELGAFHCYVEYAKNHFNDLLIRITVENQSQFSAPITILPTLWIRNQWDWGYPEIQKGSIRPGEHHSLDVSSIKGVGPGRFRYEELEEYSFYCDQPNSWIFTDNETNHDVVFSQASKTPYTKDAFHRFVVDGQSNAVNAVGGTKAAMVCQRELSAGESWTIRCRLSQIATDDPFGGEFDVMMRRRAMEAQQFYAASFQALELEPSGQHYATYCAASAGLLWSKKFYSFNVRRWLKGDPGHPVPAEQRKLTDYANWKYLNSTGLFLMPDAWEYPYFCKWDLMFHAVACADLDPALAKQQVNILRTSEYAASNAQVPAYEWAFSDVDPPLGAWAAWRVFTTDRSRRRDGDWDFLVDAWRLLLVEYGWWANRTDRTGHELFDGGFLGLDNISPFDRRYPLKDGRRIEQADGTAWMAFLTLYMLKITVAIDQHDGLADVSEMVNRFKMSFINLVVTMNHADERGYQCWDPEDQFYYDLLSSADGRAEYVKVRSLTGVIPLLAVQSFSKEEVEYDQRLDIDEFRRSYSSFYSQDAFYDSIYHLGRYGTGRYLYAVVSPERLRQICRWLFDEDEFLSPYGIRSLSKHYQDHPYRYDVAGETFQIEYTPADSPVSMFGGNSNWRGPVWIPINYLLIEALQEYFRALGRDFLIEYPTGSGQYLNLEQIASDLRHRLLALFAADESGLPPFVPPGSYRDTHRELVPHLLFHEYFNGDTGQGVGASHQTGWTAMVRRLILQRS